MGKKDFQLHQVQESLWYSPVFQFFVLKEQYVPRDENADREWHQQNGDVGISSTLPLTET